MNVCITGVRRRLKFLAEADVTRKANLTPKAKIFYKIAKGLLKTARRLENRNASARERIEQATKAANIEATAKGKVNALTLRFIQS